jgi:sugar lactone lactonase YvrE
MNFSLPVPIDVSPDGKAIIQSVPTSIVTGPDGAYYVSELTGYPFPEDGARIYKVMPGMEPVVYADGFTQIIDLAFGPDRSLYVLEYAANSLTSFNPTGALFQILPNGEKRNLNINGLIYPGGLAIGSDSDIYISNYSSLAGQGQVLRIDSPTSVPEPSSTFGFSFFVF